MNKIVDVGMRILVLCRDGTTDTEIENIIESHFECEVSEIHKKSEGDLFFCKDLNKIPEDKDGKTSNGKDEVEEMLVEVEISKIFTVSGNLSDSEIEEMVEAQYDCEEAWVTEELGPEDITGPIAQLMKGQ